MSANRKSFQQNMKVSTAVVRIAGAAIGTDVRGTLDATEVCNKGDVFIVIDGPQPRLAAYLDIIRNTEPAEGFDRVLVPGDRARECREQRLTQGVPVADEVWERLQILANSPVSPTRKFA